MDTCRELGIAYSTVKKWRCTVPGFREAEQAVKEAKVGMSVALAKGILQGAAPRAALKVVERATEEAQSDRQLVASQRAAETVLKGAGATEDRKSIADEGVKRVDVLAMRLWFKRHEDG